MKAIVGWIAGAGVAGLAVVISAAAAAPPVAPEAAWAYPVGSTPTPAKGWDNIRKLALPGAPGRYTEAQTRDRFHAVDWRPNSHPPMPQVVADGRPPNVNACGFCHLPGGEGRPENAALAGLPHDYIISQVRAFATGARVSVVPGWGPSALMSDVARHAAPADVDAAADYFTRVKFTSHVRVVEAAAVPRPTAFNFILVPGAGQRSEPLGQRIVEGPGSLEAWERRDSRIAYTAYVPIGSLRRGAALAAGADGTQPCEGCHGEGLRSGGLGPPLAGRSPTALFRQLYAFKTDARSGADAEPMRIVTAKLSAKDMIALAAYAGSLRP